MQLTKAEVVITFFALNRDKDGKQRTFPFSDLGIVAELSKKFEACTKDGNVTDDMHEIDLTSEERVKIKAHIEEQNWPPGDACHVLSLVEKLK